MSQITDLINQASSQFGVPASLLTAVGTVESGLNPNAPRGAAGEIGPFQLLPNTAAGLNVNPFDLQGNVFGAAKLLKQNFNQFGNWADAVQAFNAGPGAVGTATGQTYTSKVLELAGLSGSGDSGALTNAVATQNTANAETAAGAATSNASTTPQGIISSLPTAGLRETGSALKSGIPSGITFLIGLALAILGIRSILA